MIIQGFFYFYIKYRALQFSVEDKKNPFYSGHYLLNVQNNLQRDFFFYIHKIQETSFQNCRSKWTNPIVTLACTRHVFKQFKIKTKREKSPYNPLYTCPAIWTGPLELIYLMNFPEMAHSPKHCPIL